MIITATLEGGEEFKAHVHNMDNAVHQAILKKMTVLGIQLEGYIKNSKLDGQVLQKRTGRLQSSIQSETIDGEVITTNVFSNASAAPYNRAQEYGAIIPEQFPVNAKALHFFVGGQEVFAKHAKGFTLKERSYMRSSLAEYRQTILDGLREAAVEGATST